MSAEAKCNCQNCSGHVSFPVEMAGQMAECPHCHLETRLFIPPMPAVPKASAAKLGKLFEVTMPRAWAPPKPPEPKAAAAPKDEARMHLCVYSLIAAVTGTFCIWLAGDAEKFPGAVIFAEVVAFWAALGVAASVVLVYLKLCEIHMVAKEIRDRLKP